MTRAAPSAASRLASPHLVARLVVKGGAQRSPKRHESALDEQTGDLTINCREAAAPDTGLGRVRMNNVTGLDRPRVLYRIDEAAELLSISKSRVYELVRSGQIRTVKVGKSHRVPARSLDEYVARLLRGSAGHGKTA